jgi:hypothetical protein
MQDNLSLECQKYPDSRYEDCMRQVGSSYDDYVRELDAAERAAPDADTRPR